MSTEVKWSDKGATISTNNAVKEFPILTNDVVEDAIKDGSLDSRQGTFMGKTYTKLLRHQVKKLAKKIEKAENGDGGGGGGGSQSGSGSGGDDSESEEEETREIKWSDKGATVSDKNAVKEFPALTMETIEAALDSGVLESRTGNFMGKTYRKLLRHQVENLANQGGGGETGKADAEADADEAEEEAVKGGGGGNRKRVAEIEAELERIDEKKRKLLREKKSLEQNE